MTTLSETATRRDTIGGVPTPDDLVRQAEAVRRVKLARIRRDQVTLAAQAELYEAIVDALHEGASVPDIAEAAGVSRQWVYKLQKRKR